MEKLLNLLFYFADIMKVRSSDPVTAALNRAERGAILGSIGAFLFMTLILCFAPEQVLTPTAPALEFARLFQYWFCWGLAGMGLLSTLFGLYQVARYILVLKWPERFVDCDLWHS
jgi:hypothetical protein